MQGTLVNAAGEPVSGAEIHLTPLTGGMQAGGPAYTTVSDDNGAFVLENIRPAPRLGLTARKAGSQEFRYGAASQPAPTVPIPIAEGESLTGLVLVMELEGVLTGRVVSADGKPIPTAMVIATNTSGARTFPITATTNARGEFRIAGLRPGSYYLAAQQVLRNLPGTPSTTTSMATYYPGVTDRNAATALDVTDGKQTTGLEIRIQQAKGYMVRGTLTAALPGETTVISATPKQAQADPLAALNETGAIVDPAGTFTLGPLAPGEYQVRATALTGGKFNIVGTAAVTIVNADVAGVTLTPLRTYAVTGKVALEDGTVEQLLASMYAARPGFGVRGAAGPTVTLTPTETGGTATQVLAIIGADGTFRFDDVRPGLYTLASPSFTATYLKSVIWAGGDVSFSELKIESDGEFALTYRRGAVRVTGNARDVDGRPPAGATALVWPVEPRPGRTYGGARASAIDSTGAFAMPDLPPGLYYAAAFPGINGVTALEPRFHRQFNDRATVFEIRENMPVTLDIQALTAEMVNEALKKPQ